MWALTAFLSGTPSAAEAVDLTAESARAVADGAPPLTLVVDGIGFFHKLFEEACPGWEWILGGDYPVLADALERYVGRLRQGGVELVVALDPAQGTEEDDKKTGELQRRFQQRCEAVGAAMELLASGVELHADGVDKARLEWQMPQLSTKQAVRTLRKLGVPLLTCEQEADAELASIVAATPGGFAVTGRDSDFFLMRGMRYVPLDSLTVEGEGAATVVRGKVFTAGSVAAALGLPESRLFELAWLVGNDNSSTLLDDYKVADALGLPTVQTKTKGARSLPKDVAAFLAKLSTPLAHHPPLLALDPHGCLVESLEHCRCFYEQGGVRPEARGEGAERGAVDALLCEGMKGCALPATVLGVHRRGVYMSSVKHESMFPGRESEVDRTLRPLRRAFYSLLVGRVDAAAAPGGAAAGTQVSELVRHGHERKAVAVEVVEEAVLARALGCADLRALRERDDAARRRDLHLLLHLVADARLLAVEAVDGAGMDACDALLNLSDTLLAQVITNIYVSIYLSIYIYT